MTWLTATPVGVVRACATMLPRLEAEEALQTVSRTAAGVGRLPSDEATRLIGQWLGEAGVEEPIAAVPPVVRQQHLAAMGIGLHVVNPEAAHE